MTKSEFLSLLRDRLSALPREDAEERLGFYAEMIDDRIEEGLSEEEAVAAVGSVDRIASQILSETMSEISKKSKKPKEKRKMKTWEIVLLAAGSPVWLSLLIALFAVIISLYAVMWSLVASAGSVFGALIGSAIGVIFVGAVSIIV